MGCSIGDNFFQCVLYNNDELTEKIKMDFIDGVNRAFKERATKYLPYEGRTINSVFDNENKGKVRCAILVIENIVMGGQ